ncbi:MAG: heme-copper oxidase subunit III [Bacteroidetes bacterium]|nr:heme-copper oxidase subunit III [Bacteroidota bacterium]
MTTTTTSEPKVKPNENYKQELRDARKKTAKPILWLGIVSIVMLFAGLTSAYVVRADNGNWLLFNLPDIFYISTAIIVTSSVTMVIGLRAARKNNFALITLSVLMTLVLGLVFCYTQYLGWSELWHKNIVPAGKYSNASGSFLYVLTGLHMAHLAGGLISLLTVLVNSIRRKYNAENTLGLELCSIYWHFLDILWVYLFLFLLYIR